MTTTRPFGTTAAGEPVRLFRLTRGALQADLIEYGATLVALHVPDAHGRQADVVLGFDDLAAYESADNQYLGGIVGRCANRIGAARFVLDGTVHELTANDGPNHLHGGARGFDRHVWRGEPLARGPDPGVRFTRTSPAGEEGYPGGLRVAATYSLGPAAELVVDAEASCDAPTLVNLTQHSYWNLAGAGAGTILDHELRVFASRYTPTDARLIPTGALAGVAGTPFDFRHAREIGSRLAALDSTPARGYDLNYVLDAGASELHLACSLRDPRSGRVLEIRTSEPGLQLYSGDHLRGQLGKGGAPYERRSGLCLEAQRFPDAIHHPAFPSVVLRPGETYRHRTVHRFVT
jgi:aldose 1-epimerase